jgi:hypothetical protein
VVNHSARPRAGGQEPADASIRRVAVTTGYYTRERLLELAEQADAGFDRRIFADLLDMLHRYPDRRFAAYAATSDHIAAMRTRFENCRDQLMAGPP